MISRTTTKILAEFYAGIFTYPRRTPSGDSRYELHGDKFYDYLFEGNYDAWFLNSFKYVHRRRLFVESIMKIHTGESLASGTPDWTWKQREKLGQRYLKNLAEDILEYCEQPEVCESYRYTDDVKELRDKLKSKLELDGYIWKAKKLLFSEAEVLDSEEERGILDSLVNELNLDNQKTILHHLELSEEHYLNKGWDDSISNSRKFLESIYKEVAARHNMITKSTKLSKAIYENPKDVRDYLKNNGLIEEKEKKAIASIYSLLSGTGGHPYIAKQDQARLLRHVALTFCQFVMLRLKGYISQKT